MLRTMKRALKYSLEISENPAEIKKNMEHFFASAGYDQRYKFKWKALSGNTKYTYSGIFEYYGQEYYFSKMLGELELERR